MYTTILVVLLTLVPLIAFASGTARCTTREDPALQRWVTECTDGSRAITRWDAGLQRYRTDITKAPQGDQAPRGWPKAGKVQR
jgi:hypothetical protein